MIINLLNNKINSSNEKIIEKREFFDMKYCL